jgi:uncharacterized protein
MANLGYPKVVGVIASSSPAKKAEFGVPCLQGVTLKGEFYTPLLISNWEQFVDEFGGLETDPTVINHFPLLVKQALSYGGSVYVSRVGHYDTDEQDFEGAKATATIGTSPNQLVFTALAVGKGYNGVKLIVANAVSGDNTKVDITESWNGKVYTVIRNFPKTNTVDTKPNDIEVLNNKLKFVSVSSVAYPSTLPVGTATTTGGTQDIDAVVDVDYVGNQTRKSGWYAFDVITDSMRIWNVDRPNYTVDNALRLYCENRGDMRFGIRVDDTASLDAQEMIDYRKGEGSYSHDPFDTYYGDLFAGTIIVTNPYNAQLPNLEITAIGHIIGLFSKKDRENGIWTTAAGPQRGVLKDVLGVKFNLYENLQRADFDRVYDNSINAVVKLGNGNVVIYGNKSLSTLNETLLRSHKADTTIYVAKSTKAILEGYLFEPNAPITWRAIYINGGKPFLQNLASLGAFVDSNENVGWFWNGDQNAKDVNDVVVNNATDIQNGIYKVNLGIKVIDVMEYINFTLNSELQTVSFSIQ